MRNILIATSLLLLTSSVLADSFRCGNSLVKSGDSVNTLVKKCGNPERKFTSYVDVNEHGRRYSAGVINWVYERSGKKDMIVSVRNGEIIKIKPD